MQEEGACPRNVSLQKKKLRRRNEKLEEKCGRDEGPTSSRSRTSPAYYDVNTIAIYGASEVTTTWRFVNQVINKYKS